MRICSFDPKIWLVYTKILIYSSLLNKKDTILSPDNLESLYKPRDFNKTTLTFFQSRSEIVCLIVYSRLGKFSAIWWLSLLPMTGLQI
jgi:hypothetical protein